MLQTVPCIRWISGLLVVIVSPQLAVGDDAPAKVNLAAKPQRACILIWLEGGPPSIDMWDLKPQSRNGGPFRPIPTAADNIEICEHLPKVAKVMDKLSIIRSIVTRGEIGERAHKYMHTGYVPNPMREHPSAGAVIARELGSRRPKLTLPPYISLNGPGARAGYLEHRYDPLVVDNVFTLLQHAMLAWTMQVSNRPIRLLDAIDADFDGERGLQARQYSETKQRTLALVQSNQLHALNVDGEDPALRAAYGHNEFGQGLLVARKLVEQGVPFVEVSLNGWDVRDDYFEVLRSELFPTLDAGLSTLVRDLEARDLYRDTIVVVTGAFTRSPRIQHGRRYHASRQWSLVVGGGGIKGGTVIGQTDADGVVLKSPPIYPQDLWATVGRALEIPLDTLFKTHLGRPMRIFNGGEPIAELLER